MTWYEFLGVGVLLFFVGGGGVPVIFEVIDKLREGQPGRWLRAFRDIGFGYSFLDRIAILWLTRGRRGGYAPLPGNQILIRQTDRSNDDS